MKTDVAHIAVIILLSLMLGLVNLPGMAADMKPPSETLAGLKPGVSSVKDAVQQLGSYSIITTGWTEFYAGGGRATSAYNWTIGGGYGTRALSVETTVGQTTVNVVLVDRHPLFGTSRGLRVFMPESDVWARYGMPDYAFEWTVLRPSVVELFYLDEGLIVVLSQVPGRLNWTITKLILTYPSYLFNAVSMRERQSLATHQVIDITRSYLVWTRMAQP